MSAFAIWQWCRVILFLIYFYFIFSMTIYFQKVNKHL